jgi:hypothetical protein
MKIQIAFLIIAVLTINLVSAVVIDSVDVSTFAPGQEGTVRIEIENVLNDDVEDLSVRLQFSNLPFIPIGSSEQSLDELDEGDDEDFVFTIKASPTITPGDYEIPYTISYNLAGDDKIISRTGSIGVKVKSNPELSFGLSTDTPVEGRQGTITLKIVNKGFSDARFVSVKVLPEEFILLSDAEVYIGEIESDDFETANFDVRFTRTNPEFRAIVEYINFDNEKIIQTLNLPLTVYSEQRATELGIIQPSKAGAYISIAVTLILILILWRIFKKRQRLKRSQRLQERK